MLPPGQRSPQQGGLHSSFLHLFNGTVQAPCLQPLQSSTAKPQRADPPQMKPAEQLAASLQQEGTMGPRLNLSSKQEGRDLKGMSQLWGLSMSSTLASCAASLLETSLSSQRYTLSALPQHAACTMYGWNVLIHDTCCQTARHDISRCQ